MTTTETCPVCRQHLAVRGMIYGIDAYVCPAAPSVGLTYIAAGDIQRQAEAELLLSREALAPSIYERHYPLGGPQAWILDEVQDEAYQTSFARYLSSRSYLEPGAITYLGHTPWVFPDAFEKPRPSDVPDPALGEGAVSPTRHLRNWKNRACTPSSLRSPPT